MKQLIITFICWAGVLMGASGQTTYNIPNTHTAAQVQTVISGAVDGDIINLAAGTHTWSTQVVISSKALRLKGAGGGGILTRSETAQDITATTKTWTLDADVHQFIGPPDISVGEALVARFSARGYQTYLEGTVTAFSFPSLSMDITNAVAGGSLGLTDTREDHWCFTRTAATTVIIAGEYGNDTGGLVISSSPTGNVRVEDIYFQSQSGGADVIIQVGGSSDNPAPIIERCWFGLRRAGEALLFKRNGGVVSRCSFDAGIDATKGTSTQTAFKIKFGDVDHPVWTEQSYMGPSDPGGIKNVYIESCYLLGFGDTGTDTDDNGRSVTRYCIMDHSATSGHGMDTGNNGGPRYVVVYKCAFPFKKDNVQRYDGRQFDVLKWWGPRGSTGIVANNYMEDIRSSGSGGFGDKTEIQFRLYTPRRDQGLFPCWGYGDSETVYPAQPNIDGEGYPSPRQHGYGYVDGSGTFYSVENGKSCYGGDPEPIYIWGNFPFAPVVARREYNSTYKQCGSLSDRLTAYIKIDEDGDASHDGDVIVNVAKPGWSEYTYPHPLVASATGNPPVVTITAPANSSTHAQGASITFTATATDTEDGNIAATLTWTSSLDGSIGSGASFATATLTNGTHSITAAVTDSEGNSSNDNITIIVASAGVPVVTITSPANGATFKLGDIIPLTATATDTEDGDVGASLLWYSESVEGAIATGADTSTDQLSEGEHIITAKVTDSSGNPGEDSVTITVKLINSIKAGTLRIRP